MREIASKGQLRAAYLRWAVVTVPLVLLLGFASASLAPNGSKNPWYRALVQPEVQPPDWAFPVVWSTLYVMLGLALAMVVNARGSRGRGGAIALFAAALAANYAWSPTFFAAHKVGLALAIIVVMLVLGIATTFAFARIRKAAAWLMVPYLVWVSFAGVLNWRIGQLNPDAEALVPGSSSTQIAL